MDVIERRYRFTLSFLTGVLSPPAQILDLGIDNPLAARMRDLGYDVVNTPNVDLDLSPQAVQGRNVDAVTAFEILEHLVNPFSILSAIDAPRLITTIPLRLWFATAYKNPGDEFDQHFHEFEPWQFDRLIEKSGWEISSTQTWTGPTGNFGFRPLLRRYTPRYYAVEARRNKIESTQPITHNP